MKLGIAWKLIALQIRESTAVQTLVAVESELDVRGVAVGTAVAFHPGNLRLMILLLRGAAGPGR